MVTVDAGTLLLGTDRTLSRRLVAVAGGVLLLATLTGLVGHLVEPLARAVGGYGSLVLVPLLSLVGVGAAYRSQGLAVCWLLAFTPLYGAIFNGFAGITGAYPTVGEWFVMGVQFGAVGGLLLGTTAFLLGFAARLVADRYGGGDPRPA
ncbi:hypothetical protein SAMN04487948_105200 [Halogranum amylolyticum]|uniref:Uncharacterized protein n=1 Tax=Halogranum amylolyticum TaxID=660520 RepID=A0A1H8SM73_9EURY|nr:hypothetical protein [Halogranum amylolyticum]SEO79782.1 hypothetical protein SAMN04487948_105200 [Halogranum amylolyticum]